jgi:hypothetical protein
VHHVSEAVPLTDRSQISSVQFLRAQRQSEERRAYLKDAIQPTEHTRGTTRLSTITHVVEQLGSKFHASLNPFPSASRHSTYVPGKDRSCTYGSWLCCLPLGFCDGQGRDAGKPPWPTDDGSAMEPCPGLATVRRRVLPVLEHPDSADLLY